MTADKSSDGTPGGHHRDEDPFAAQLAFMSAENPAAQDYLKKRARLLDLEIDNLEKQDEYEVSHLRWRRFNDQMSGALQIMLVLVGVLIVSGIAAALWSAANDSALVIESFSVPPDMTAGGLTGQVVAAKLLDRLSAFEKKTESNRAPSSYTNNWGDDIKVQIPDTGVSIGEFNRFLKSWLGHETHITGEITHTATGIAVTARVGGDGSATFAGAASDLDKLADQAAEAIYRATQPYRYAVYLMNSGRTKEAERVFDDLIAGGSPQDRVWADIGLANIDQSRGDVFSMRRVLEQALALRPDFVIAFVNIAALESQLQHDEQELAAYRKVVELDRGRQDADLSARGYAIGAPFSAATLASELGDYQRQIALDREVEAQPEFSGLVEVARVNDADAFAAMHDASGTRRSFETLPPSGDPQVLLPREASRALSDLVLGNQVTLLQKRAKFALALSKLGSVGAIVIARALYPNVAYAMALAGDVAGARAQIAHTPADCFVCLRMRGRIESLGSNWRGANGWFARAVAMAPSLPFGDTDWGEMLLRRGDYDGAIAKFDEAHAKGSHFADPLEMWGEALMQKNRSDLALAKFQEAARYAPNWGRLHLKWGEALDYSGRMDEARAQYRIAAALDLSVAERALVAKRLGAHD